MTELPNWAAQFTSWIHPAALITGTALPFVRAAVKRIRKEQKCWNATIAAHDFAAGLVIPSFLALALSPLIPEFWKHVEPHAFQLAGAMGIVYTITAIFGRDHGVAIVASPDTIAPSSPPSLKRPQKTKRNR